MGSRTLARLRSRSEGRDVGWLAVYYVRGFGFSGDGRVGRHRHDGDIVDLYCPGGGTLELVIQALKRLVAAHLRQGAKPGVHPLVDITAVRGLTAFERLKPIRVQYDRVAGFELKLSDFKRRIS